MTNNATELAVALSAERDALRTFRAAIYISKKSELQAKAALTAIRAELTRLGVPR